MFILGMRSLVPGPVNGIKGIIVFYWLGPDWGEELLVPGPDKGIYGMCEVLCFAS